MPSPARHGGCLLAGLTGGIATGKTTVAGIFADLGAAVIDADPIVHQLLAPGGAGVAPVREHFGEEVLDPRGGVDRSRLGRRVFSDPAARRRLEALLHPLVIEVSEARIARILERDPPPGVLIYEAALLVETGRHTRFDRLVVVTAPLEVRVRRLVERRGLSVEEARRRIGAQMPEEEKIALADHVIDNGHAVEQTRRQVERVYRLLGGRT
ncbi:MAG: dephospho-CoA kinase [Acidobacteriota bacterium]|nr:dephospho-CoA kinase [Acidobacteriota bacterium]MDQ7088121.1 dephospho-CoA kinase [Acidobacteriota bacterium]